MKQRYLLLAIVILLFSSHTIPVHAANLTVTPGNLQGWLIAPGKTNLPAVLSFVTGPGTPPAGVGSYHAEVTSSPDAQKVEMFVPNVTGTNLNTLSHFSYYTYLDPTATNTNNWYANIYAIWNTGAKDYGFYDERLDFVPPVGIPGNWTATENIAASTSLTSRSGNFNSVAELLTAHPTATILEITIAMGDTPAGPSNYSGYKGNLDAVNVNGTIYDFELNAPSSPSGGKSSSTVSFPQAPPVPLCSLIDGTTTPFIRASVPNGAATYNGTWANVYCGVLTDPVQYGVFDRTVIHAVEVFALTAGEPTVSVTKFSAPVLLCLQGSGAMLYRDATNAPRVVTTLPSFSQGDFTCANLPNAGTAILVAGAPSPAASAPDLSVGSSSALDICQVTTLDILNLRQTPELSGTVLDQVPYNATLKATAKQGDWFEVVFGSNQGWLSAKLVSTDGFCQ